MKINLLSFIFLRAKALAIKTSFRPSCARCGLGRRERTRCKSQIRLKRFNTSKIVTVTDTANVPNRGAVGEFLSELDFVEKESG